MWDECRWICPALHGSQESQELFRQASQPSTGAAPDLSLSAVTKRALGYESPEVHLVAVKHLANHLLMATLSP